MHFFVQTVKDLIKFLKELNIKDTLIKMEDKISKKYFFDSRTSASKTKNSFSMYLERKQKVKPFLTFILGTHNN